MVSYAILLISYFITLRYIWTAGPIKFGDTPRVRQGWVANRPTHFVILGFWHSGVLRARPLEGLWVRVDRGQTSKTQMRRQLVLCDLVLSRCGTFTDPLRVFW